MLLNVHQFSLDSCTYIPLYQHLRSALQNYFIVFLPEGFPSGLCPEHPSKDVVLFDCRHHDLDDPN